MRTLVFDLDGTLTDSVPDIAAAVNRTLATRGLPPLTEGDIAAMTGDGVQPLIARAFAAAGGIADPQAGADYLASYEAHVSGRTRLYPGVAQGLATLARDGWTLAVCTNKPAAAARKLLDAMGIAARFAAVGGGDSFAACKPDARHLVGTIAQAGGSPARALMAGDHANDVAAARGCGVKAIFAAWGYGKPGMAAGAEAVAADFGSLVVIAGRLLGSA